MTAGINVMVYRCELFSKFGTVSVPGILSRSERLRQIHPKSIWETCIGRGLMPHETIRINFAWPKFLHFVDFEMMFLELWQPQVANRNTMLDLCEFSFHRWLKVSYARRVAIVRIIARDREHIVDSEIDTNCVGDVRDLEFEHSSAILNVYYHAIIITMILLECLWVGNLFIECLDILGIDRNDPKRAIHWNIYELIWT